MNIKVLLNIPNTIGYIRIILLYISIFYTNIPFIIIYSISMILDACDGYAARKFNQSTFLGSCLDMITDRISTVILFIKIVSVDKSKSNLLTFLILTDLLSHFLYFSNSLGANTHHKSTKNMFLKIYYRRKFLLTLCLLTEIYYVSLYAASFISFFMHVVWGLKYFAFLKTFFHGVHLYVALKELSNYDDLKNEQKNK